MLLWDWRLSEWCDWLALTPILTAFRNFSYPPLTSSNTMPGYKHSQPKTKCMLSFISSSYTSQLGVNPFHTPFNRPVNSNTYSYSQNLEYIQQASFLSCTLFKEANLLRNGSTHQSTHSSTGISFTVSVTNYCNSMHKREITHPLQNCVASFRAQENV